MVGRDDRTGAARSTPIDYFVICVNSLGSFFGSTGPASIDPATGKPYRLGFPGSIGRRHRARRLRSGALARHRAARYAHRPFARRHDRAGVCGTVSGRRAAADRHLGHRGGFAVRYCAALHPARSHSARPAVEERQLRGGPAAGHRHAHRAHARHDDLPFRGRMARSVSAASPIAAQLRRDAPFAPEFAIQGYLEAHARKFVRRSIRAATSTSRERWIASIWLHMAIRRRRF